MAKKSSTPSAGFVEPMQCLAVAKLPEGPEWEYEIKFDGYRALGINVDGRVQLFSRNGNDFSVRYPLVTRAVSKLPDKTVIDGEIVASDERGLPRHSTFCKTTITRGLRSSFTCSIFRACGEKTCARARYWSDANYSAPR
jgi:bifunctional non-homologous end joining protein LigD